MNLASRGGNYSIGRQLNIVDGVRLSDLDEFDQLVIQKVEHSGKCWHCRRWMTTLKLILKLLKNDAFWGVLAEYLKILASSFCRSKYIKNRNIEHIIMYFYRDSLK